MKGLKWAMVDTSMKIVGQRLCLALGKLGSRRTGLARFGIRDQGAAAQRPDASKTGYGQVLVDENGPSWVMRCRKRLHQRMGFDPRRPDQPLCPALFPRPWTNHTVLPLDHPWLPLR